MDEGRVINFERRRGEEGMSRCWSGWVYCFWECWYYAYGEKLVRVCWLRFCIGGFSLNIIGIIIAYNK